MRWLTPVALVLVGVATAALLFIVLRAPFAWSLDVGTPPDQAFLVNFFPPEQYDATTFRWSGPGSRLVLHSVQGRLLRLSLRLNGDMLIQESTPHLALQREGQRDVAFRITPGWRVYHVLLPDYRVAQPVRFISALHDAGPEDGRLLGVVLDGVAVASLVTISPAHVVLLAVLVMGSVSALVLTLPWLMHAAPRIMHAARHIAHTASRSHPWFLIIIMVLAHVLMLPLLPVAWRGVGAWLVVLLPGVLLVWGVLPANDAHETPLLLVERLFLGLCGGMALASLLVLLLHAVPGPLHWWLLLLVCDVIMIMILIMLRRRQRPMSLASLPAPIDPRPSLIVLVLVLLIAAALRFPFLGSAEFQGDEGLAILAAVGIRYGYDDVLMLRPKGPGEVVLPAMPLVLTGQLNEWVARLPFALAGMGVLVGCVVLARSLFMADDRSSVLVAPRSALAIALLAAGILALDGFLIAYARIVQYQSIVMLMSLGALWCCWRFYMGTPFVLRYLLGAALLAGVGMLAHYDGIFVLPAMGWLVLAGGWRRGWRLTQWLTWLVPPLLVGAGLLLAFYIPLITHEHFITHTKGYLDWRIGQQGSVSTLFNNLPGYYQQATFYNTTFQIHLPGVVLLVALLVWLVRYVRPRSAGWLLAALLLTGCVLLLSRPAWFTLPDGNSWAIVAFAVPLAGLALAPATPVALRVLVLWFAVPFTAMSFLIEVPNTHYYTMDTAAALLIALALVQVWHRCGPLLRRAMLVVGVAVVVLTLPYLYIVYVRQVPEYQRSFPAARPALYRASYGDGLPVGGYFGFPHRDGWKVIGELYRQGVLDGSYTSNQKERMTAWYTRGAPHCTPDPDYYLLARGQSYVVPEGYHLWGYVVVDNRRALDIYSRERVTTPHGYDLADYRSAFETQRVPAFPLMGGLISGPAPACDGGE